jgi:hypothetical protein
MLSFAEGSVGQLLYTAQGSPRVPKEALEIHGAGATAVVDDFRSCAIYTSRHKVSPKGRGKGHLEEMQILMAAIRGGTSWPIPKSSLFSVARLTLQVERVISRHASSPSNNFGGGEESA